jgi:hypothetical protein
MAVKSNDLSVIFGNIMKSARAISIRVAKDTAKKIGKDLHKKALENIEIYYRNYDPDVYDRTYNLRNVVKPYYKDTSSGQTVCIDVGVVYDSTCLEKYSSNSWYHQSGSEWVSRNDSNFDFEGQGNGVPDPEWIFENFWNGIHPRTTTSYEYAPIKDPKSQKQLMEEFIDNEVPEKVEKYMNDALIREFSKRVL